MNVSLKISETQVKLIKDKYHRYQKDNPMEYVIFFAKVCDTTISVFKSPKKILYSLTITSGKESQIKKILKELKIKDYTINHENEIKKLPEIASKDYLFLEDQIGSDEVGTGDFFGPITVVAALVRKKDIARLKALGVMDSKKISDEKIRKIGKIVIKEFPYSSLAVDNKKYNELTAKGFNMNKIKCYLHNKALSNLHKKYSKITNIYVDQFVDEKIYYKYLSDEKEVLHKIYFHTKGESYFPSVALASVIARYSFLEKMDALNKKYKTTIPFGAGANVDKFAKSFVKKYGLNEISKITKVNFKNYQKLTE
ncbi:MAG: ribonuclease HIII [Bacilli bacterium]|nr:ribonuclease HIII [Bacilli bacterium]